MRNKKYVRFEYPTTETSSEKIRSHRCNPLKSLTLIFYSMLLVKYHTFYDFVLIISSTCFRHAHKLRVIISSACFRHAHKFRMIISRKMHVCMLPARTISRMII